ncbi:MAG: S8 family serine peptidase [Chloroflexi bacterium]|jgi:subtilisin family serine protease|nr:S8 family serine peptidase [Chloroflexota bacterium]
MTSFVASARTRASTGRPRNRARVLLAVLPLLALMLAGAVGPVAAQTDVLIDGGTANARCAVSYPASTYPGIAGPDELSDCQWDMSVIGAPGARATATGLGVRVGVIDGGVDFNHPDLAGAIDVAASCSFIYSDTPTADPGEIANGDCTNKAAVQDLQGHGTHVATTIAARVNGIGIVGVAPEATIVALKACTIDGFCFADSVAAALRYAGDLRLDVVNLSLFADPYLFYCKSEAEQRAILASLESAARYAQQRGVVIVAAAGNEAQDLGHPSIDDISPDWPPDSAIVREVRNSCQVAPAELPGVVTVSASGVNTLASYSNVGSPVDVTAPGGDAGQTPSSVFGRGRILAGWSSTDATGSWDVYAALNRAIVSGGGRYVWISGTSMASPHAAGVAALIRQVHPGMPQGAVAALIRSSATPLTCPAGWPAGDPRQCTGGTGNTSFFGAGMLNAANAVK